MSQLREHVYNQSERAYEPGVFDCCTFASSCIELISGTNPMGDFVKYNSFSMPRIIKRFGSLENAVTFTMGYKPVGMDQARDGWPVLVSVLSRNHDGVGAETQQAIAVYINGQLAMPCEPRGLTVLPFDRGLKTWSI